MTQRSSFHVVKGNSRTPKASVDYCYLHLHLTRLWKALIAADTSVRIGRVPNTAGKNSTGETKKEDGILNGELCKISDV